MKVSFSVKGLMDFPPSNIQKAAAINGLKILLLLLLRWEFLCMLQIKQKALSEKSLHQWSLMLQQNNFLVNIYGNNRKIYLFPFCY